VDQFSRRAGQFAIINSAMMARISVYELRRIKMGYVIALVLGVIIGLMGLLGLLG